MSVISKMIDKNSRMGFIGYDTYKDNNKEFLRGDMWELKVTSAPKIVYYPGDDIINARLNSVNVGINYGVTPLDKRMRGGYTISQGVDQDTSGTLSLSFVDREDQAITYFVQEWRNRIADPDSKYSFRKDDVVMNCELYITNSSRIDVRKLSFYNCHILNGSFNENGDAEAGTDRSDVNLELRFEHYSREFLNL